MKTVHQVGTVAGGGVEIQRTNKIPLDIDEIRLFIQEYAQFNDFFPWKIDVENHVFSIQIQTKY